MIKSTHNLIAEVLEHNSHEIKFLVDDVVPETKLLSARTLADEFSEVTNRPMMLMSHDNDLAVIPCNGINPLVYSVYSAFNNHYPLVLSPDLIWITLAQGFAQHVNNNAEDLRRRFVRHDGKLKLTVKIDQIDKLECWQSGIDNWMEQIFTHIDPTIHRMLVCDFTTTTPTSRIVSQIIIMDAFQKYFDYIAKGGCGIPTITLQGNVDDWLDIKERVIEMSQFDLKWWTDRLLPICNAFIETAKGRPPLEFWRRICKPKLQYGAEVITGWLALLFPYISIPDSGIQNLRNPLLEMARKDLDPDENGIAPKNLPNGLSQVPLTLIVNERNYSVRLLAGFIGLQQDQTTGAMLAEIGWGVQQQDDFIQKLDCLKVIFTPTKSVRDEPLLRWLIEAPKELFMLIEILQSGIFYANSDHAWQLLARNEIRLSCLLEKFATFPIFMELADGRVICYVMKDSYYSPDGDAPMDTWILLGRPRMRDSELKQKLIGADEYLRLDEIVVIAKGIPQLFERILQANGRYFFDEPDFQPEISAQEVFKN